MERLKIIRVYARNAPDYLRQGYYSSTRSYKDVKGRIRQATIEVGQVILEKKGE